MKKQLSSKSTTSFGDFGLEKKQDWVIYEVNKPPKVIQSHTAVESES